MARKKISVIVLRMLTFYTVVVFMIGCAENQQDEVITVFFNNIPDAAFVSASPAEGYLTANGSISVTFDNNPGDVTVTGGGTVSTSGKTRTISPAAAGYPICGTRGNNTISINVYPINIC